MKKVCNNLTFNFEISEIPMVVCNLNFSNRSTLFNSKLFLLQLNIGGFLEGPNSIKRCCNDYKNSFINNNYGHIIKGNLNIFNNEKLQLISKVAKYREQKGKLWSGIKTFNIQNISLVISSINKLNKSGKGQLLIFQRFTLKYLVTL